MTVKGEAGDKKEKKRCVSRLVRQCGVKGQVRKSGQMFLQAGRYLMLPTDTCRMALQPRTQRQVTALIVLPATLTWQRQAQIST
jgi:hypothetical protein